MLQKKYHLCPVVGSFPYRRKLRAFKHIRFKMIISIISNYVIGYDIFQSKLILEEQVVQGA